MWGIFFTYLIWEIFELFHVIYVPKNFYTHSTLYYNTHGPLTFGLSSHPLDIFNPSNTLIVTPAYHRKTTRTDTIPNEYSYNQEDGDTHDEG